MSDKRYISKCFELAKNGNGFVSPNPLVGAVLVKEGKIIGRGWHKKYGEAHAEVIAINNSTESVNGSTLYCNLEPCCHTKKQTPPCVPLIIEKKIKKVVISNIDPNTQVAGKGVKQLRDAGIEVFTGIAEDEGKELNKFYFKFVAEKIPYLTLKIAQSIDGKISESKHKQTWFTGTESISLVHKLRSEYDAVLVGANTIKVDDPQLNVRKVRGRNPYRIVLDGNLSIPLKSKVINSSYPDRTIIITSKTADKLKINKLFKAGIRVISMGTDKQNKISIKSVVRMLTQLKITSVLVEGGGEIFSQFLRLNLFDEILILQAPKILGRGYSPFSIEKLTGIKLLKKKNLGKDLLLIYGKK